MELTTRLPRHHDFTAYYDACFGHSAENRHNDKLRAIVKYEWDVFLNNPATLSMLAEDVRKVERTRIVGFAQTVFVSDDYVAYVCGGAPPHPNMRVSQPLPDGSCPLLSPEAVESANSKDGLNVLTTRWDWDESLSLADQHQVRAYLDTNYALFTKGYQFKHLLCKATGIWACEALQRAGYHLITDFAEHYKRDMPAPPLHTRPFLLGVTREEALNEEGSHISNIFLHTPPRLGLHRLERELLFYAMRGLNDMQIAQTLHIALATVKQRWLIAFDQTVLADSDLICPTAGAVRGPEKRGPLLHYLRSHLEELRPLIRSDIVIRPDCYPTDLDRKQHNRCKETDQRKHRLQEPR